MHPLVQVVVAVGAVVVVGLLAMIAGELKKIRILLVKASKKSKGKPGFGSSRATSALASRSGYAIYSYRNGRWIMEADFSNPGYEAAQVTMAGSFEGQVIKKESALKMKG